MNSDELPLWAFDILRCPTTGNPLRLDQNRLLRSDHSQAALIEKGVVRFAIASPDPSITFYSEAGGARFHERAIEPFAMSALDTSVYHAHLNELCPREMDQPIVDVGGGDGRNAKFLLERGHQRVILVDAVAAALMRFRDRLEQKQPELLDSILFIEADARHLPIADNTARSVISIETLCYLNEDYELGLAECVRILQAGGVLIVSDRDYEGGLVLRLIYHGISGLLQSYGNRSLWDGRADALVRSRTFTEQELTNLIKSHGLQVKSVRGMSLLPLVFGWLRGRNLIQADECDKLPAIRALLAELALNGRMRRCHVVAAASADATLKLI
jgi:SAM-dependent methyltransferase